MVSKVQTYIGILEDGVETEESEKPADEVNGVVIPSVGFFLLRTRDAEHVLGGGRGLGIWASESTENTMRVARGGGELAG